MTTTTKRIPVEDLLPGMQVKDGHKFLTVTHIARERVCGDGEFDDYTLFFVYVDARVWAPNRGHVQANAQYEAGQLVTVAA